MTIKVPSNSDGLMEVLTDHAKLGEFFSENAVKNGTTKEFLDAYVAASGKKNPDTTDDIQNQVKSVLFDMFRENGAGDKPPVNINFKGGRPELALTGDGTPAVSRGRGAVYNRTAPGAAFEQQVKADDRFSSIGEYMQAIREEARPTASASRKDLLRKLENVRQFQNSFGSEDPGAGGFLIPEIMRSELLQLALENSIVRQRATVIPMSTLRVPIPAVDETSHASSLFGGVVFYWAEESASITESQATFGRVVLDAKKLTGFFKVPNELLADAPAFSGWFDTRVPAGLAWYEDLAFLTETGAGTPMGVLNSPGAAIVTTAGSSGANLFTDITNMYARMLPTSLGNAVWVASIDLFPTIAAMANGTQPVFITNVQGQTGADSPAMTILGRPVIFTEKVPKAGVQGDLSFIDFSYYLIGDRQAVSVASSEHFAFQNDQTAYRIIERVDGRPWVQSPLTPHNGSTNTLSPYVIRT